MKEIIRQFKTTLTIARLISAAAAVMILFTAFLFVNSPANDKRTAALPALSGGAAINFHKENGSHFSPSDAVTAARYEIEKKDAGATGNNVANGLDLNFNTDGLQLKSSEKENIWNANWSLSSFGYGKNQTKANKGDLITDGNRVEIKREKQNITEWFVNEASGVEHGFTLAERPASEKSENENLRLVMKVDGDLTAKANDDGQMLTLLNNDGEKILNYEKLKVWDADGKDLTARMRTDENIGEIWLEVEDKTAVYPLTIDPTFVSKTTNNASDKVSFGKILGIHNQAANSVSNGFINSLFNFTSNEITWNSNNGESLAEGTLRVTTNAGGFGGRWIHPTNYESSTYPLIEFAVYLSNPNGSQRLTSGSVNVTLPPWIEFDRNFGDLPGLVTVTGSGQNVTINMSYSQGINNWNARFYGKIKPLTELPLTPPDGEIRWTGSTTGPSGTYSINDVKPASMFYTKPKWTRLSQGPVYPGDEVEFKIETQNYPHAPSRSAELRIHEAPYTEFVPGSFTGLDNAIVTDGSTSYNNVNYKSKKLDWGNIGRDHTITYKLKIKPDIPADVSQIQLSTGLVPEYEWSIPPALGKREKVLDNIILDVEHSDVRLAIELPNERLEKDDTFVANVKVTSSRPDVRTITFDNPLLKEQTASGNADDNILTLDSPPVPPPFDLTPENPSRTFAVPVKVNKLGVTELVSSLSFTGDDNVSGTVKATEKVSVPPLKLTLDVTPEQFVLNQTEDSSKTAECVAHELSNSETKNCIEITATIKNDSDKTVKNIVLPEAENPLRLIASTDPESPGVPLTKIDYHPPRAGQIDLAPGEEAVWTWHMNAFDSPAKLKFEPLFLAGIDGEPVRIAATKKFKILENVLLKWGMRPTDGRTNYQSGQNVRADGYIENVSAKDGGEEKLLRVLIYQMPQKNVGGGFVFKSSYSGPSPTEYEFFDLPAKGAEKRLDINSVFRSFKTSKTSSGFIEYGVRVWIVEDDGKLTLATDQALLDDDYVDEFTVLFSPDQIIVDQYVQDCLDAGFMPILCSFNQALAGEAVDGAYGLYKFALTAREIQKHVSPYESIPRVTIYNLWAYRELMKSVLGNEQAKEALLQDMYGQYLKYHNLGILSGQVIGQAPMAFGEFSNKALDSIGRFMHSIATGNINEVQVQLGHFLGANPDMLFEPLVVGRSFVSLGKSLKRTAGGLADNVFTAAARAEAVQRAASVEARVAAAASKGEDLATALVAGDVLKPSLMRKVFGVSDTQVKRLQDFARKNDIILAFRSRHPKAQTLLDAGLAYAKAQAFKQKTVNLIDINFLGYRRKAEATIEIVEPPAGIIGKEGAELTTAVNAYMDVLTAKNPALGQNKVLREEVRDRLEGRAKEWNKYAPQLKLNDLDAEVKVGVNFGASDQFVRDVSGDVGVNELRKVERNRVEDFLDPVTGTNRRRWEIKMEGPNGAKALPITGDIDFLGILDKFGNIIRDENKRIAIYKQMQEFMEHGESMSYRYEELRKIFVGCCVEGKEAMMTVGPWKGEPRAGHFVDNLSVMDEFNADFKRVRGTEPVVGPAGEIKLDADGNPIEVTLRHEDTSGEFSLINGTPLLNNPDRAFVARFAPLLFETVFNEFKQRIPYYFPSILARIINANNGNQITQKSNAKANANAEANPTAIFRRGGPVIQVAGVSEIDLVEPDALRIWTVGNGWQPISPKDAFAAGDPNLADLAPNSSLPDGAEAGEKNLTITPANSLEFEGDFFDADDVVVINPGGSNQEIVEIESVNPIVLKNELVYKHNPGEMIAVIIASADNTPTGNNVSIQTSNGSANITFSSVTQAGSTTFTPINPSSTTGSLPNGYTILDSQPAYNITTTAAFTPPVSVCFVLSSINEETVFAQVRLLHGENGQLVDRTILPSDFSTRTVCARVSSLGQFVVALASPTAVNAVFDFDGDGRSDISTYRPNEGNWYLNQSTDGSASAQFGLPNDQIAPADYDGDGKTDVAVWRESEGNFYIINSSDGSTRIENFGLPGDKLTVGDWDGDGKADLSVYRDGSQSVFYFRGSNNNPNGDIAFLSWGTTGDIPMLGDYDGDGKQDAAVFRPSNNTWIIRQSSNNQVRFVQFGLATDTFVPADYDGDSMTDLTVFRNGTWYILQSSNNQVRYVQFGLATDRLVPADYDGDGKMDVAVYRDGIWYINQSRNGFAVFNFGVSGDTPIPNAYINP